MRELTALQQRWVTEYLIDLNATAACRRAGYKGNESTLRKQGYTNLRLPHITQHLAKSVRSRLDKADIKVDMVLAHLAAIAFSNIADYLETKDGFMVLKDPALWTPEQRVALAKAHCETTLHRHKISIRLANKVKALGMLARYFKILEDGRPFTAKPIIVSETKRQLLP